MSQAASTHQGICFLVLWVEGGSGYSENTSLKKKEEVGKGRMKGKRRLSAYLS